MSGTAERWQGSDRAGQYAQFNLVEENLYTRIPIVAFKGRGLSIQF